MRWKFHGSWIFLEGLKLSYSSLFSFDEPGNSASKKLDRLSKGNKIG